MSGMRGISFSSWSLLTHPASYGCLPSHALLLWAVCAPPHKDWALVAKVTACVGLWVDGVQRRWGGGRRHELPKWERVFTEDRSRFELITSITPRSSARSS